MKLTNIIKDLSDDSMSLACKLELPVYVLGDALMDVDGDFIITVPLNYRGVVDDKFIRFINKTERIKLVLVMDPNNLYVSGSEKQLNKPTIAVHTVQDMDNIVSNINKQIECILRRG